MFFKRQANIDSERIAKEERRLSYELTCYAIVDFIRTMVQECYPQVVDELRDMIEEEGDEELCLCCASGLTEIPVDVLIPLVTMGILEADKDGGKMVIKLSDLLDLIDVDVDYKLPESLLDP